MLNGIEFNINSVTRIDNELVAILSYREIGMLLNENYGYRNTILPINPHEIPTSSNESMLLDGTKNLMNLHTHEI